MVFNQLTRVTYNKSHDTSHTMKDRLLKFKSQNIGGYEFITKENLRGIDKAVEAKR